MISTHRVGRVATIDVAFVLQTIAAVMNLFRTASSIATTRIGVVATVTNMAAALVLAPAPTRAGGCTATAGLGVLACLSAATPMCTRKMRSRKRICDTTP